MVDSTVPRTTVESWQGLALAARSAVQEDRAADAYGYLTSLVVDLAQILEEPVSDHAEVWAEADRDVDRDNVAALIAEWR